MHDIVQALTGCGWGRTIHTAHDDEPCAKQAQRIVVLHSGEHEIQVRLCLDHLDVVTKLTDPHAGAQ